MVAEIWSAMDRSFCHFEPIFVLLPPPNNPKNQTFEKTTDDIIILNMCTINDNYMIYGSWDMKRDGQNFFVILDHFLPFYPPNNLKNQNFEKVKKTHGDIIILNKCTKNHDHMLHCSWDTMRDGCNSYFLFWGIFCPFNPPHQKLKMTQKNDPQNSFLKSFVEVLLHQFPFKKHETNNISKTSIYYPRIIL